MAPSRSRTRAGDSWIDNAAARLARLGSDPEDDDELRQKKALLVLLAVLILPVSAVWGAAYLAFGSPVGIVPYIYLAVSIGSLVLFARTRDFRLLLVTQLLDILLTTTAGQMLVGGFLPSGGVGLWGILAPLGALVFLEVRRAIRWFVAFVLVFLLTGVAGEVFFPDADLPIWFTTTMLALNVIGAGAIAFTLLASFADQRNAALAALRVEQEKSELLLMNILPGSIAQRLKAASQTIADHFDSASILFADVVDFTPLAQRLPPAEVVGILDQLFSRFDTLLETHGLEKIKTIGDCYMAAAGVPDPSPDHARRAALLALDMREAVAASAVGDGFGLELRIGINSGPVIAGVIGSKRFLYDLWGDAVNTASRMESHGTPGEIQITRATYELLKDEFVCRPRGTIEVKGKGLMETWYLVGPRSDHGRTDGGVSSEEREPSLGGQSATGERPTKK
ncbi:MAG: adenylate/guanylate cyclase domain-containing protein [Actinobacteria bacterium]|nr:MAG: adenylate/guanylate cyclase domain-containing protein [Actinomycetota bacterium]